MPRAHISTADFKGTYPAITMAAVRGDAITADDAAIDASSAILEIPGAGFSRKDIGKIAIVVGAGTAGGILEAQIQSIVDGDHVTLATAASTTVSGVEATWGTDNHDEFQKILDVFDNPSIPVGRYLISGQIALLNRVGLKLYGFGDTSTLIPTSALSNNFIDVSGSVDLILAEFKVDGRYFPDLSLECIYGDGTTDNPAYGNIKIRSVTVENFRPLCFGIGANTGKTIRDVTIDYCRFRNCGAGSFGANVIDTGSSGIKQRYKIIHNRFEFVDQPTANPGNAIFAGHGINEAFDISHNTILDCPTTGIAVYNRPFLVPTGEATSLKGVTVSHNVIHRPGWNGITNFGGHDVAIIGNEILNPGYAEDAADETRCGIYLSDQQSVSSYFAAKNVNVTGNVIVDDQVSPTMRFGIFESLLGTAPTTGLIASNRIYGFSDSDVVTLGGIAVLRTTGVNHSLGAASATAPFNVPGDIRAEGESGAGVDLFTELSMKSAASAGAFKLGVGLNVRFDGINWITGFDGSSNGYAAILHGYGSDQTIFVGGPKTGGTAQTISPATLATLIKFLIDVGATPKLVSAVAHAFLASVGIGLGGTATSPALPDSGYLLDIGGGGNVRLRSGAKLGVGGDPDATYIVRVYGGGKFGGTTVITTGTLQVDGLSAGVAKIDSSHQLTSVTRLDAADIGDGSVSNTEFEYINSLTSNAQTQLGALDTRLTALESAFAAHYHIVFNHNHGGTVPNDAPATGLETH